MITPDLRKRLEDISCGEVRFASRLAPYTSFAIGGPADALVSVQNKEMLISLLELLRGASLPWRVIGKGSNLLVSDAGYRGVVIVLKGSFTRIGTPEQIGEDIFRLSVGAGCSVTRLNTHCCRMGLTGAEFSYGIPGSLGGAVFMNAGAWGGEMSQLVTDVGLVTIDGYEKLTAESLDFCYRKWPGFQSYIGRAVIVDVGLKLRPGDSGAIREKLDDLLQKRNLLHPHKHPSGGSFFKNPAGDSAGRLIEACGLKGRAVGGAMVSEKHANFIINTKQATAADVLQLADIVSQEVKKRFGFTLEPEIQII
ncbi:UDP-N-acetylmuramate dehydrogenase [Desulforhopalus sp. IMCC35007]|uniref:UDP-N-acetylmuramate dehydrogenase n=1 Tax=Desulforhopalus sp. IMCC35007 TaxID=2569543 RepID=UPI0010ADD858|nr:UDP-N-acetylmuramate dehydrogenase [Desulforhopalus sp. IMCC35007]TKB06256.1 UDP-N-acetylmuramate dehydrogenase [Desulforhopalus sp. IMCC35007]